METPLKDKMYAYNLAVNGVIMDDIVIKTGIHYKRLSKIIKEMSEVVHNNRFTKLGKKDEPYYECEEDYALTPVYEWNDLNLNEIEFYEKYGKGRKKS